MPIEATFLYPSDLVATYPQAGDNPGEGDDHLRGVKNVLKTTLPNVSGAITPTHTQLNYVAGVTSAIQTQIDSRGLILLASASASASAAIDFTSLITSAYTEYELHIINAIPSVAAEPRIFTSANAGTSWDSGASDYDWLILRGLTTTAAVTNGGSGTAYLALVPTALNVEPTAAWGGFSAVVRFYDPAGTSHHKRFMWTACGADTAAAGTLFSINGTGSRAATAAINGVRYSHNTGTITSGLFRLYGVKA